MKISSFGKSIPKELFSKIWAPVINSVLVLNFILKFYQFGSDTPKFVLSTGLIGAALFAIVTVITSYIQEIVRTVGIFHRLYCHLSRSMIIRS